MRGRHSAATSASTAWLMKCDICGELKTSEPALRVQNTTCGCLTTSEAPSACPECGKHCEDAGAI